MNYERVPTISVRGRHLWQNRDRFIVRGVVYQTSVRDGQPSDPLADCNVDSIKRDVCIFKELGLNAMFVYRIDPDQEHDKCMEILAASGMYVVALASDHKNREVILRSQPRKSYTTLVQRHFHSVASCMARYDNTLGLCISNDLITENSEKDEVVLETCEVLMQATRELKHYMRDKYTESGQRILPVCIADTFWSLTHTNAFEILTGSRSGANNDDTNVRLDFYCINHYVGPPTSQSQSDHGNAIAWNMIHTLPQFHDAPHIVPILLSEYSGNNLSRPRSFQETADLYSKTAPDGADTAMLHVLSGGFVYEYFEHANRYGLVKLSRDTGTVEKLPDYYSLREKFALVTEDQ